MVYLNLKKLKELTTLEKGHKISQKREGILWKDWWKRKVPKNLFKKKIEKAENYKICTEKETVTLWKRVKEWLDNTTCSSVGVHLQM